MKLLIAVFILILLLFGILSMVAGVETIQTVLLNSPQNRMEKIVVSVGMVLLGAVSDWAVVWFFLKPRKPTQEMPPNG